VTAPIVKGWCPGAYRPMMSGDGLIVRVRPRLGRLDAAQALGLCRLAQRFGSGVIDLTNRANLQLRGVSETGHEDILIGLAELGLLDVDPATESRRNLIVTPFWQDGDATATLARGLMDRLAELPELPAKFGYAIDLGPTPVLQDASADIRLERGAGSELIVRMDGLGLGRAVSLDDAVDHVITAARWFAQHAGTDSRRMSKLVAQTPPPPLWCSVQSAAPAHRPDPGKTELGLLVGVPFGQIDAAELAQAITTTHAKGLRITPWRLLLLEGAKTMPGTPFIGAPGDPLLNIDACPGAPFCAVATVETRALARSLAGRVCGTVHVSGCAKGCARKSAAAITLVGRAGAFDLVRNGCSWDDPQRSGLSPNDVLKLIG
jgi:precorrin-3B synthase